MFWIHGGHFDQGAGGVTLYDGGNVARKGEVILVTFNYRLGALGWLVTEDLGGNFGFEDQLLALNWVKQNIAAFGGDPNQVSRMEIRDNHLGHHLRSKCRWNFYSRSFSISNEQGFISQSYCAK
jgi:hypothetical protein